MKFTIYGFSQKKLVEMGMNNDDALILRYFIDFKDSGAMIKEYMDDDMYYWVNYESLKNELPVLNISKDRIYRRLKYLVSINVLKHKTKKNGGTFSFYAVGDNYKTLIIDTSEITDGTVKTPEGYGKNTEEGTVKIPEGYGKNTGTKYSSIKDTSINNSSIKDIYVSVIDYLNQKCCTSYKSETKKTRQLIKARVNEGFNLEHFKTVIDKKYKDWKGTDFEAYLRPETLFGNKFESYLNQKIKKTSYNSNGKPSTFNDFDQREYDFDSLERKLLGWDKDAVENE
ncbi:conserved phage C-terminal domain-containing protein [Clostridium omnivorum]|uniref:Phage conserved hypothetical protein C-terminal domain-containing protein n=1 Tax=Clostridium omnivorum TaxID=1604902 RepID=A0ABQ5ND68_9CLOT|nr:conserved phage C-terminal domain-containing protein [Clostridium sp. E14]GLC32890.1 hypothetical protein bsdE14_43000 [Clostridium sp. E14]